jgi:hypothetical protein
MRSLYQHPSLYYPVGTKQIWGTEVYVPPYHMIYEAWRAPSGEMFCVEASATTYSDGCTSPIRYSCDYPSDESLESFQKYVRGDVDYTRWEIQEYPDYHVHECPSHLLRVG